MNLDLELRPLAGDHVGVSFVLARRLLAQPEPFIIRRRDVLRGVIAPLLILGAAVGRADVETLVLLTAGLHPEGHADKAARIAAGSGAGLARDIQLYRAIVKLGPAQK